MNPAEATDPLAPLRDALLARARADATAELDRARDQADALAAQAAAEATAVLADARARGVQDAEVLLTVERAEARRAARDVVLGAQGVAYGRVRAAAAEAVRRLLAEPGAHEALVRAVTARLGPGAVVVADPEGGVRGSTPRGRAVDASAPALVDAALDRTDLSAVWEVR